MAGGLNAQDLHSFPHRSPPCGSLGLPGSSSACFLFVPVSLRFASISALQVLNLVPVYDSREGKRIILVREHS